MDREKMIFDYIREYIAENGWAPAYQEIADAVDLKSKSDVRRYLRSLEDKGIIRKGDGPRMIALIGESSLASDERDKECESKSTPSSCRVQRRSRR